MFSVKFMTNDCQISFTQIVTEDDDTLKSYKSYHWFDTTESVETFWKQL